MDYLPINVDLKNQAVLVFGAGEVAKRKIKMLLKTGARVTCIGLQIDQEIRSLASLSLRDHTGIKIKVSDLRAANNQYLKASFIRQLINTVDEKKWCNYITPAIVDRNPVLISISSGGSAPVLAKNIKAKLEQSIPHKLGTLAKKADGMRDLVKASISGFLDRKRFWNKFFVSSHAEDVLQGRASADDDDIIHQLQQENALEGEVLLVGAGPGDSELLTIKALQSLQKADVVFHDRLVSPEILELIRKDAELFSVGKSLGHHSVPQSQINELLIQHAKQGKKVVRLKGGDPFVFGRGGEEIQALKSHDVKYQIVPGITAAVGCSAYAGIPLTHRDFAQNVLFITAHCKDSIDTLDWVSLAREQQTIAVYMGLMKSAHLSSQLIKHGKASTTPVALIENGTHKEQRVISCELQNLATTISQYQVQSPTLIVIGEVVALADELAWFKPNVNAIQQPLELKKMA
jgi:uroporphyrin-III C-methyltransferase/precorrin-2 dehydrogenase/sirohydrochlorin ferrochelatase